MKLRYLIPSFIAALTMFVSCSDEFEPTYLGEVQLSSSYVAIPQEGGSTAVKVTATGDWAVDAEKIPAWLTVSPAAGGAGETTMTFSADAAIDGRTAELLLTCGGKTQHINVIQGLSTVSKATCAEVIAGPDSKTYRVTGVCTAIANTNYGNWYLQDATGQIYIYGTVDKSGKYNWTSFGIEVGDEVTVEGPKTTYNGTVELVDVQVISVNKSLIKIAEIDPEDAVLPIEGGDFTVTLSNKGQGVYVTVPEDAASWLSIVSISGNVVKFRAAANQGGDRSTNIVFKTTDGKKEYTCEQAVSQKGAIIAATVADFLAAEIGTTQYRLNGIITRLYYYKEDVAGFYIADYSGETLVYKASGFTGAEAKPGDVVTVSGQRGDYKGNAQMVSGTFEELNHSVTEISIADFRNLPDNTEAYYRISGEIVNATEDGTKNDVDQYGNFNLKDSTGEVYIYGVLTGWGGAKGKFGELGLTWGDKLTIIAYKTTFKAKNLVEGVGVYFSHEKAE
ncbi:MAG: DNA-binding protein [Prevotella sp.]|nr:DNA-binding protein [Prevotella sp.]